MAGPILNKQPIFTATPILTTAQFDPAIPNSMRDPGLDAYTVIYLDESSYGSLITKVTVTAAGSVGERVTTKVIYLGILDAGTSVATLYQSKVMTGINDLTATDVVPYVTFEFGGGLVMNANTGNRLVIAASTNSTNTSEAGDEIGVIVEGGTYDQPS
jgi:hypothetical protein